MRKINAARAGAVFTAAALALSLGAGPVSANDAGTDPAVSHATTTALPSAEGSAWAPTQNVTPTSVGDATLKAFAFNSSVITSSSRSYAKGRTAFTLASGVSLPTVAETNAAGVPPAYARIKVNGVVKSIDWPVWITRSGDAYPGVELPRTWGSGAVKIDQIVIATKKAGVNTWTPVTGSSNTFYARKHIKSARSDGIALKIHRSGKKIRFKAQSIKIVNPSSGKYGSLGKVKLQVYKSGKWRTKKTIKLNKYGNGSYSTKVSKKYRYRLHSARTSTKVEFRTYKSARI